MSERQFIRRWFFIALFLRLFGVVMVNALDLINRVNYARDSRKYDEVGRFLAERLSQGQSISYGWIDHGWFTLTGFSYYLLGDSQVPIQLLNALLGAFVVLFSYRLAKLLSGEIAAAKIAMIIVALMPSLIFWSSVPMKDTASIFAMTGLVYCLCRLRLEFSWRLIALLVSMLLLQLALREYLFLVAMAVVPLSQVPVHFRGNERKIAMVFMVSLVLGVAAWSLGFGFLAVDRIMESAYFDVDYINDARRDIAVGAGSIYAHSEEAQWGSGGVSDLTRALLAAYYFVVSLDFREIGSIRQLIALPEVLFVLSLIYPAYAGTRVLWRYRRDVLIPVLVYGFAIAVVYGAATTNMGAMYRWRAQVIPLFVCLAASGIYFRRGSFWYRIFIPVLGTRRAAQTSATVNSR